MKEAEMEHIGDLINEVVTNMGRKDVYTAVAKKVEGLCARFPLYPELRN
jgi:glycine/serine hydroxymethyltransferase